MEQRQELRRRIFIWVLAIRPALALPVRVPCLRVAPALPATLQTRSGDPRQDGCRRVGG